MDLVHPHLFGSLQCPEASFPASKTHGLMIWRVDLIGLSKKKRVDPIELTVDRDVEATLSTSQAHDGAHQVKSLDHPTIGVPQIKNLCARTSDAQIQGGYDSSTSWVWQGCKFYP